MQGTIRALYRGWNRVADALLAAGLSAAAGALYLATLAPTVAALYDDSLEFALVAHRLAIAHPTGYPLYTLLAALFARGPWANPAWGVNLLSAAAAALTVAFVYLVARALPARRLAAMVGAAALAVSPVFWSQAVLAEVYTLNTLLVAALLWLTLLWARRPLLPVTPFARLLVLPRRPGPLFLLREEPAATRGWEALKARLSLPPHEPGSLLAARQTRLRRMFDRVRYGVPGAGRSLESLTGSALRAVRRAQRYGRHLYRRTFPAIPPKARLRPHPLLYVLAGTMGLALAHHRTAILLAPALCAFFFAVEHRVLTRAALLGPEVRERPRWLQVAMRPVFLLLLSLLFPLLLYLYLPLRGEVGSLDGTYENTLSGFWSWVTAGGYGAFFADNPLARDLDAAFYARLFWEQFGPAGLALALVGLVALLLRFRPAGGTPAPGARWAWLLTGVAFVTYAAFAVLYRVPDVEVFFLPVFLLLAIWIAAGADYAITLLRPRGHVPALRRLQAVTLLLVIAGAIAQPLVIGIRNYPHLDLSRRWTVHDWGVYVLSEPLPEDATIVALLGEATLLRYLQETAGWRPDVEIVAVNPDPARRQAIDAAYATERTVFVTRPAPGLAQDFSLSAVTGVIDVLGEPETFIRLGAPSFGIPDVPRRVTLEPIPGLELLGYGLRQHSAHWQAWARLRLWWRAPDGLDTPFKVSARLLDASGTLVAAGDAEPVSGLYPAPDWRRGEIVADAYEIPLPAGLPPGEYIPLVIIYDPATGTEWARARLDPVSLEAVPVRPPRRALEAETARILHARFRDLQLLGFTPPDPAPTYRPGSELPITLLWQAGHEPLDGDWRTVVFLEGNGRTVMLEEAHVGGGYRVDRWHTGQVIRQWLAPVVPAGLPAGEYALKLRVMRDGHPVPWGRGWLPLGSDLSLANLHVVAE